MTIRTIIIRRMIGFRLNRGREQKGGRADRAGGAGFSGPKRKLITYRNASLSQDREKLCKRVCKVWGEG